MTKQRDTRRLIRNLSPGLNDYSSAKVAFDNAKTKGNTSITLDEFRDEIVDRLRFAVRCQMNNGDPVLVIDGTDRYGRIVETGTLWHEVEFISGAVEQIDHAMLIPLEHPTEGVSNRPTLTRKASND